MRGKISYCSLCLCFQVYWSNELDIRFWCTFFQRKVKRKIYFLVITHCTGSNVSVISTQRLLLIRHPEHWHYLITIDTIIRASDCLCRYDIELFCFLNLPRDGCFRIAGHDGFGIPLLLWFISLRLYSLICNDMFSRYKVCSVCSLCSSLLGIITYKIIAVTSRCNEWQSYTKCYWTALLVSEIHAFFKKREWGATERWKRDARELNFYLLYFPWQ